MPDIHWGGTNERNINIGKESDLHLEKYLELFLTQTLAWFIVQIAAANSFNQID